MDMGRWTAGAGSAPTATSANDAAAAVGVRDFA
jgi:hypothetical protein